MEKQGVRGLICITGIGSGDSQGHGGFVYDKLILPFLLKNIYQDKTDKNRSSARAIWIGSLFVQHY
jgi:hypothetical protein